MAWITQNWQKHLIVVVVSQFKKCKWSGFVKKNKDIMKFCDNIHKFHSISLMTVLVQAHRVTDVTWLMCAHDGISSYISLKKSILCPFCNCLQNRFCKNKWYMGSNLKGIYISIVLKWHISRRGNFNDISNSLLLLLHYFVGLLNPLNASVCKNQSIVLHSKSIDWFLHEGNTGIYWVKNIMKAYFSNVVRYPRLRLWVGYFIYFKFTPVLFYGCF